MGPADEANYKFIMDVDVRLICHRYTSADSSKRVTLGLGAFIEWASSTQSAIMNWPSLTFSWCAPIASSSNRPCSQSGGARASNHGISMSPLLSLLIFAHTQIQLHPHQTRLFRYPRHYSLFHWRSSRSEWTRCSRRTNRCKRKGMVRQARSNDRHVLLHVSIVVGICEDDVWWWRRRLWFRLIP